MGSLLRRVRLLAVAVGLLVWLMAVPAASAQEVVVARIHDDEDCATAIRHRLLSLDGGEPTRRVRGVRPLLIASHSAAAA